MPSSGTYLWQSSVDELLTEAWERCGKAETSINGTVARSARRSLQLILIDWTNRGLNLWQADTLLIPLAANQQTVTLPPNTVDVIWATVTDPLLGQDFFLSAIGGGEYAGIPLKTQPGRPTQYWTERVLPAPVMHLYRVPDQAYTLNVHRMRQPQDVSGLTQTPDAPVLWAEAITAELARRLAVKFAPDRLPVLVPDAERTYTNAFGEERERVPLILKPDLGGYGRW